MSVSSSSQERENFVSTLISDLILENTPVSVPSVLWQEDKTAIECTSCKSLFSFFRRRHHCRFCGRVFCDDCSSYTITGYRCCQNCYCKEIYCAASRVNKPKILEAPDIQPAKSEHEKLVDLRSATLGVFDNASIAFPVPIFTQGAAEMNTNVLSSRPSSKTPKLPWKTDGDNKSSPIAGSESTRNYKLLSIIAESHLMYLTQRFAFSDGLPAAWVGLIYSFALRVAKNIRPSALLGENMSLSPYIKIKVVTGGKLEDSLFVSGVIFGLPFSRRRIPTIKYPRILLLGCSLTPESYSAGRRDNSVMPQSSSMSDESGGGIISFDDHKRVDETIRQRVQDIIKLNPHVLMVSEAFPLSRLALDELTKKAPTIVVVPNSKSSTLRRLARCTMATVVTHPFFTADTVQLGTCKMFCAREFMDEPELYAEKVRALQDDALSTKAKRQAYLELEKEHKRISLFFDGCNPRCHCTIHLRGAAQETLSVAKRCLLRVIHAARGLALETALLCDLQVTYQAADCTALQAGYAKVYAGLKAMREQAAATATTRGSAHVGNEKNGERKKDKKHKKDKKPEKDVPEGKGQVPKLKKDKKAKSKKAAADADQSFSADKFVRLDVSPFASCLGSGCAGRLDLSQEEEKGFTDMRQAVLKSSIVVGSCWATRTWQCFHPHLQAIDCYTTTDKQLGSFLMENCFNRSATCVNPKCKESVFNHLLSFEHNASRLTIRVQIDDSSTSERPSTAGSAMTRIFVWSRCRLCSRQTPEVMLSPEAFNISFGHFLNLLFNNEKLVALKSDADEGGPGGACTHAVMANRIWFFRLRGGGGGGGGGSTSVKPALDIVCSMERAPVQTCKLVVPSHVQSQPSDYGHNWTGEQHLLSLLVSPDIDHPLAVGRLATIFIAKIDKLLLRLGGGGGSELPYSTADKNPVSLGVGQGWSKPVNAEEGRRLVCECLRQLAEKVRSEGIALKAWLKWLKRIDSPALTPDEWSLHSQYVCFEAPEKLAAEEALGQQPPTPGPALFGSAQSSSTPSGAVQCTRLNIFRVKRFLYQLQLLFLAWNYSLVAICSHADPKSCVVYSWSSFPGKTASTPSHHMEVLCDRLDAEGSHFPGSDSWTYLGSNNRSQARDPDPVPPLRAAFLDEAGRLQTPLLGELWECEISREKPVGKAPVGKKTFEAVYGVSSALKAEARAWLIKVDELAGAGLALTDLAFLNSPQVARQEMFLGLTSFTSQENVTTDSPIPPTPPTPPQPLTPLPLPTLPSARQQQSAPADAKNQAATTEGPPVAPPAPPMAETQVFPFSDAEHHWSVAPLADSVVLPVVSGQAASLIAYSLCSLPHLREVRNVFPKANISSPYSQFDIRQGCSEDAHFLADPDRLLSCPILTGLSDSKLPPSLSCGQSPLDTPDYSPSFGLLSRSSSDPSPSFGLLSRSSSDPSPSFGLLSRSSSLKASGSVGSLSQLGTRSSSPWTQGAGERALANQRSGWRRISSQFDLQEAQKSVRASVGSAGASQEFVQQLIPGFRALSGKSPHPQPTEVDGHAAVRYILRPHRVQVEETSNETVAPVPVPETLKGIKHESLRLAGYTAEALLPPLATPDAVDALLPRRASVLQLQVLADRSARSTSCSDLSRLSSVEKPAASLMSDTARGKEREMEMVLERERPAPAKGFGNETSHPSNPTKPKQPEAPLRGLDAKDKDAVYRCLTEAVSSSELYIEFSELGTLLNTDMHPPQTFACTVFYATPFHALRRLYCLSDFNFVHSLWSCRKWPTSGGKKGQLSKTLDSRYLLKSIEKAEFKWFVLICPAYFAYMARCVLGDPALPSVLVPILGLYKIKWPATRNSPSYKEYYVAMPNLFHGRNLKAMTIFDLKGSDRNRHAKAEDFGHAAQRVWLDHNLMEYTGGYALSLQQRFRAQFRAMIYNDSVFLASQKVVDYSLILGIEPKSDKGKGGNLVIGLIDYLQPYNLNKQIENLLKSMTGSIAPTIVAPESYKQRFQLAMDRYMMIVPTHDCPLVLHDLQAAERNTDKTAAPGPQFLTLGDAQKAAVIRDGRVFNNFKSKSELSDDEEGGAQEENKLENVFHYV